MSRTNHIRHLRHRRLDGLSRGTESRRRLRHLDAWIERLGNALVAYGGLSDTGTQIAATFTNATNVATVTAHGYVTGDRINLRTDNTLPAELTAAANASGTFTFSGQPAAGETVTIDGITYTFVSTMDHAQPNQVLIGATLTATMSNLADAIDADFTGNTKASANQTITGNPSADDTITIGGVVYTFKAAPAAVREVRIGATANDTLATLAEHINGRHHLTKTPHAIVEASVAADVMTLTARNFGAAGNLTVSESATNFTEANTTGGAETVSASTLPHPTVESLSHTATTCVVEARNPGTAGNAIAIAEASANGSVSGATLAGGAGGDYFAIVVDANTIQIAANRTDALSGTAIDISDDGTGNHTSERVTDADDIINMIRNGVRPETIEAATDIDSL